jgi:hypothetical protein
MWNPSRYHGSALHQKRPVGACKSHVFTMVSQLKTSQMGWIQRARKLVHIPPAARPKCCKSSYMVGDAVVHSLTKLSLQ